MRRSPQEIELEQLLAYFERSNHLPERFTQEPGAFICFVREAWRSTGAADGRQLGVLSEQKIADLIKEKTQRPFSRNMYMSCFGAGARAGFYGTRSQAGIRRDVARAFLEVALDYWTRDVNGVPSRFVPSTELNLALAVQNACEAMFREDEKVFCRLAQENAFTSTRNIMPLLKVIVEDAQEPFSKHDLVALLRYCTNYHQVSLQAIRVWLVDLANRKKGTK